MDRAQGDGVAIAFDAQFVAWSELDLSENTSGKKDSPGLIYGGFEFHTASIPFI